MEEKSVDSVIWVVYVLDSLGLVGVCCGDCNSESKGWVFYLYMM